MTNTATAFNQYNNVILRNSVLGKSNTRNFTGKATKHPSLPPDSFSVGLIANTIGKRTNFKPSPTHFNHDVVANNQFIAGATTENYNGFQKGPVDNSLPMSFLPDTQPYERKVNPNLIGRSYNDSAGYGMKLENFTDLSTPTLNTEWKKSFGILNARKQTNPFPITINENIKQNLKASLSSKK